VCQYIVPVWISVCEGCTNVSCHINTYIHVERTNVYILHDSYIECMFAWIMHVCANHSRVTCIMPMRVLSLRVCMCVCALLEYIHMHNNACVRVLSLSLQIDKRARERERQTREK
jgi:hypothetical protein